MPRRPYVEDDPEIIVKRMVFVRRRLRPSAYGHNLESVDPCPGWTSEERHRREITWAWLVREYVSDRSFTYTELLQQARLYAAAQGPWGPQDLEGDLRILKGFEDVLRAKRSAEDRKRKGQLSRGSLDDILKREIEDKANSLMAKGICPLCGGDLPCGGCHLPSVRWENRQLVPVEYARQEITV